MAIETKQDLIDHVVLARQIEMSTIPPYLYAAYSIKDQESEAARLIISVVVEEMLHLALATNLLLALGGEPDFGPSLLTNYPSLMAHHKPDLMLGLGRCTPKLIRDVFMIIEQPELAGAPPQDDKYESLGQFYDALLVAIDQLSASTDLFTHHQPSRQLSDPAFYSAVQFDEDDSGGLMLIADAASAHAALEIIIHQGEGLSDEKWADESHKELTHYHKFALLADGGMAIGETSPVTTNPRTEDFPAEIQPVSNLFNALFGALLQTMEAMYAAGADQGSLVGRLYGLMSVAMTPVARYLTSFPISPTENASPTFEIYTFTSDPQAELTALAARVGELHPSLADVALEIAGM